MFATSESQGDPNMGLFCMEGINGHIVDQTIICLEYSVPEASRGRLLLEKKNTNTNSWSSAPSTRTPWPARYVRSTRYGN